MLGLPNLLKTAQSIIVATSNYSYQQGALVISTTTQTVTQSIASITKPYLPHLTQQSLKFLGSSYGKSFLKSNIGSFFVDQGIKTFVGNKKTLQNTLGFTPELVKSEYSQVLKEFRSALTSMLNSEMILDAKTDKRWCVEMLPLKEFMDLLLDPKENYAYMDENSTVIKLPDLRFSKKLTQEYFSDLDTQKIFQNIDSSNSPRWVIRIKKIWNLLFLAEKILHVIETNPHAIATQELLENINYAYTLLFELDIDLFAIFKKYSDKLYQLSQSNLSKQVLKIDSLELSKDLGFYLGLILFQMGSSTDIRSLIQKSVEVSKPILAELVQVLQNLKDAISSDQTRSEEDKKEALMIQKDIERFFKLTNMEKTTSLKGFLDTIEFIVNPKKAELFRFIKYLGQEQKALCEELLRLVKYELMPSFLGFVEELENTMLLEPGSLVYYFESLTQQYYSAVIGFMDYKPRPDYQLLYTPNWIMARQDILMKKLAVLEQYEDSIELKLSFLGKTRAFKNISFEEFTRIQTLVNSQPKLLKTLQKLDVQNYQKYFFDQSDIKMLFSLLRENHNDLRQKIVILQKDVSPPQQFEILNDIFIQADSLTAEKLRSSLRYDGSEWDKLREGVSAILQSYILQARNQIEFLRDYIDAIDYAKYVRLSYFEVPYDFEIKFEDLTSETKDKINQAPNPTEGEQILQEALIAEKKCQLKLQLPHKKYKDFFIGHLAVIHFLDKTFLVDKNLDMILLAEFKLPNYPPKGNFIILPGKIASEIINKYKPEFESPDIQFLEPMVPFTLTLSKALVPKKYFTLDELTFEELTAYQTGWIERLDKIKKAKDELLKFVTARTINANTQVTHKSYKEALQIYFNLQGVFKYYFEENLSLPNSFTPFNQKVIEDPFANELNDKVFGLLYYLDCETSSANNKLTLIREALKCRFELDQKKAFKSDEPNPRAGYLLNQTRYSDFFENSIQKLYSQVEKYGSAQLKQNLISAQGIQSGNSEMYDTQKKFNISPNRPKGFEICYAHNCLFDLKKLYQGFEEQKRFKKDENALEEIIPRVKSIIQVVSFLDFALGQLPLNLALKSLSNMADFSTYRNSFKRLSDVYGLKNAVKYEVINEFIISHQIIGDMFENSEIRDYISSGTVAPLVQGKINHILGDLKFLEEQFRLVQRSPFYDRLKKETADIKIRIFMKIKHLNDLKKQLSNPLSKEERLNNIRKKFTYYFQNNILQKLMILLNKKEFEYDLILKNRYQLFLRLLEKETQRLRKDLTPIEEMILKLLIKKRFTRQENQKILELTKTNQKKIKKLAKLQEYYNKLHASKIARKKALQEIKSLKEIFKYSYQKRKDLKEQSQTNSPRYMTLDLTCLLEQYALMLESNSEKLILTDSQKQLLEEIYQKDSGQLNEQEKVIRILAIKDGDDFKYRYQKLSPTQALFLKIYFRKENGFDFELGKEDKKLLNCITQKNEFSKTTDDDKILELVQFNQEKGKYELVSYESDFKVEWLLELNQSKSDVSLKNWSELTNSELLQLPLFKNIFARTNIYNLFLAYQSNPTKINQEKWTSELKPAISETLMDLYLISFRAKELKESHIVSKAIVENLTSITQGHSGFGTLYLRVLYQVYNHGIPNIIQALKLLKQKSDLNTIYLKAAFVTPLLTYFDKLENQMQIKPGLLVNPIENYLDGFVQQFARQLSSSPAYVPSILQNSIGVYEQRIKAIGNVPNTQETIALLESRKEEYEINQSIQPQAFLYNQLIKYTQKYCKSILPKMKFITDVNALKIISHMMTQEIALKIQESPDNPTFKQDIFNLFKEQGNTSVAGLYTQDGAFKSCLSTYIGKFMESHQHDLKKVNEISKNLDEFDKYLISVQTKLTDLEKKSKENTKTLGESVFKFCVQLQFFFLSRIWYASLTIELIGKKRVKILQLQNSLNNFNDKKIEKLIENFSKEFEDTTTSIDFLENAPGQWYPLKYIFKCIDYILQAIVAIINLFLPASYQINLMLPTHARYHQKLKNALSLMNNQVCFDYDKSIQLLFDPKKDVNESLLENKNNKNIDLGK